jgi:hypothetical protein
MYNVLLYDKWMMEVDNLVISEYYLPNEKIKELLLGVKNALMKTHCNVLLAT